MTLLAFLGGLGLDAHAKMVHAAVSPEDGAGVGMTHERHGADGIEQRADEAMFHGDETPQRAECCENDTCPASAAVFVGAALALSRPSALPQTSRGTARISGLPRSPPLRPPR